MHATMDVCLRSIRKVGRTSFKFGIEELVCHRSVIGKSRNSRYKKKIWTIQDGPQNTNEGFLENDWNYFHSISIKYGDCILK
jgi:hypothetical protein